MPKEIYDAANPKYRCCCGCHVTTAAMIICLMYLFSDIIVMTQRLFINYDPIMIIIAVAFTVIGVIAFGLGFFGAKTEKPKWLTPAMTIVACFIIYAIVDGLYGIYTFVTAGTPKMIFFEAIDKQKLIWPYDSNNEKQTALVIIFIAVRTLIGVAFHSWLLSIIQRCYQYLTAKNDAVNARPTYESTNVNRA